MHLRTGANLQVYFIEITSLCIFMSFLCFETADLDQGSVHTCICQHMHACMHACTLLHVGHGPHFFIGIISVPCLRAARLCAPTPK